MNIQTIFTVIMGCTNTPSKIGETSQTEISSETIQHLDTQLQSAYHLWETDSFPEAFEQLQLFNYDSMKSVWPIIRAADPENALQLEVQLGKVIWAVEHQRSKDSTDAARVFRTLLLSELNDVRRVEIAPEDPGPPTKL